MQAMTVEYSMTLQSEKNNVSPMVVISKQITLCHTEKKELASEIASSTIYF